jgi:hypoxanthine phosphoribosyltransferase
MALISISGDTGCRFEELARVAAHDFKSELITEARFQEIIAAEFGAGREIPDRARLPLLTSVLARFAREHHVITTIAGAERAYRNFPGMLRIHLTRSGVRAGHYDIVLRDDAFDTGAQLRILETAVTAKQILNQGMLPGSAEAQIQFQARLKLARFGLTPPERAGLPVREFGHPSEEIFANLLDFYGIPWQYEPRSFPLRWDQDGNVLEAFTPDFFLPEFDLYIELTTMKQALVTKKNKKVKLLRGIYPHINIQIFYQKDIQDLVFKYGLNAEERRA